MKNSSLLLQYLFLLFICLQIIFLPAKDVLAQDGTPSDDEVNQIAEQLFCPVCENVPLDECMTQACEQWRDLIRQRLAEGWTEQQIKDYFIAQYGDKVLGEPPRQGLNWILYLFPPLLILFAVGLLVKRFRSPQKSAPKFDVEDPYLSMVESDLKDMD